MNLRRLVFAALLAVSTAAGAQPLPAGFHRTDPIVDRDLPTGVYFAHTGEVFVTEKNGRVFRYSSLLDTTPVPSNFARSVLDLLKTVNRELGLTILLITHEMSIVRAIADEVVVLEGGRVVEHGNVYDVFTQPQHAVTRSFFANDAGRQLPEELRARLQASASPGGKTIIRIVFRTASADEAVLSKLTRELGVDVNIITATVDTLSGKPFGWFIASIDGGKPAEEIVAYLARYGVGAELLGHVA